MALKTPAPDWFEVPNSLIDDWLLRLGDSEIVLLLVLFRRERGYPAIIGIRVEELAELLNIPVYLAQSTLGNLCDKGLVDGNDARGWFTKGAAHV